MITEEIELGDVIIRGFKRMTVIAFSGDDNRLWVCERFDQGLVRGNAYILTLKGEDRLEREPPFCECGCGEKVRYQKAAGLGGGLIWSRWRPGHQNKRQPLAQ